MDCLMRYEGRLLRFNEKVVDGVFLGVICPSFPSFLLMIWELRVWIFFCFLPFGREFC